MKKKVVCFCLIWMMMGNMLGCGEAHLSDSTENLTDAYEKKNTTEEQKEDNLSVEEKKEFEENYADFAVAILKSTEESGENSMISPLSLLTALVMAENGAKGETLSQMEHVLANGTAVEQQCQGLVEFSNKLTNTEDSYLRQANSIWFRGEDTEECFVTEEFLQKNAETFHTDIFRASFNEDTLKDINVWVSDETDGMISQILEKIPSDAMMYLINAVAFEAEWEEAYKTSQIRETEFVQGDGTSKKVSMMYSDESQYLKDEDTIGFMKPYKEGYSFVALLPSEEVAMEDYVAGMSGEKWRNLLENVSENETVRVGIPKFTVEYKKEMSEVLEKMGMPLAFDEKNADFSGIGEEHLAISSVIHKTYVSIDELGTKAGAASVVEMTKDAGVEITKEVILNRPFVYAIIDNNTNLPIFIGILEEP